LNTDNEFISGIEIEVEYCDGTTERFTAQPFEVMAEIKALTVINTTNNDIDVAEIFIETYNYTDIVKEISVATTINNPESQPVNTIVDDELVAEHITAGYIVEGETKTALTQTQINSLFGKTHTTATPVTLPAGNDFVFVLKKPFNISKVKVLTLGSWGSRTLGINCTQIETGVTITYQNANGNYPTAEENFIYLPNPASIDDEVSVIVVHNPSGEDDYDIYGIIVELEHRTVNKPVVYGLNIADTVTLEHGETPSVVIYDIFNTLGRNAHDGYVYNNGPADVYVEIAEVPATDPNFAFGDAVIVRKGMEYNIEKFNAAVIQISNISQSEDAVVDVNFL